MNLIFLLSVLLKGMGSVLEILVQIVITRAVGVDGYGTYSNWVNVIDLIYWMLFSGLVRCNTFYLSDLKVTIGAFRKTYYTRYALPLLAAAAAAALVLRRPFLCLVLAAVLLELLVQDRSSTYMARKRSTVALFGEYVLGRAVLLVGIVVLFRFPLQVDVLPYLMGLYLAQFALILLYFRLSSRPEAQPEEGRVSLRKLARYQRADIMVSLITFAPVVLQYAAVGAFEAGVVSIVMIVKRLVNFISGPAAKIFLPEFSRAYQTGDRAAIQESFASIMRIQMLFVGPLSVVLVGFPRVVLRILAPELVPCAGLFVMCAVVFLVAATLGPSAGLMQMTENEKNDNRFREVALVIMVLIFVAMRKNPFFVLYGLCAQTAIESVGKFVFISRWMGGTPVRVHTYLFWWLVPGLALALTWVFCLDDSMTAMLLFGVGTFAYQLWHELFREGLAQTIRERLQARNH